MAAFLVRALDLTDTGSKDFRDDNGSVFEGDVERLAAAGITKGCNPPTNDLFCPGDPVSRAQMAAFLHRASPRFCYTVDGATGWVQVVGSQARRSRYTPHWEIHLPRARCAVKGGNSRL
jgi:hypothetical protein